METLFIVLDVFRTLLSGDVLISLLAIGVAFLVVTRKGFGLQESWDIRKREPAGNRILKAGADVVSPVGNPQKYVEAIYSLGESHAARDGDALVFRANPGWRYGFLVGFAVIFYMLVYEGLHTPAAWVAFFGINGGLIWLGMYIWTFRVEIEDSTLRYLDLSFVNKSQDLAFLLGAEDFGDSYKLHFQDGASVFIPRYVEGHDTLRRIILETLSINGR
ncbi:hypothetical protein [Thalassococcus lentus]|uniref:Uncharacterized protein n=1 Tax=Thalassococcus lentus TaxID=1210524 RepID=A0ABT4XMZ4_9RHOB|nr:hypothetical protein [Thalassococcus lentus]MDA7423310.1 hypothetical protein [Thalassococcus lentus]